MLAAGLAFRLPVLDRRPMHADEANQAWKTGILWTTGEYRYDPQEHHGPTLYYLTLPILWLAGAEDFAHTSEWHFRLLPALVGAGMVLMGLVLRKALGGGPVLLAGLLTALSPVMVFYSRYYIQEMLLVCFTLGLLGCLARWKTAHFPAQSLFWSVAGGGCLGLMVATKETWVLTVAAMLGAAGLCTLCPRCKSRPKESDPISAPSACWKMVLVGVVGLIAAGLVAGGFYSGFGTHPAGLLDAWGAYKTYVFRGVEAGEHHHSPLFYLHRLLAFRAKRAFWTEGFILVLAVVGAIRTFWPRWSQVQNTNQLATGGPESVANQATRLTAPAAAQSASLASESADLSFCRFLTWYALLLTLGYSAIPYKTPWCALSFWHGVILLAGIGGGWIWRQVGRVPGKLLSRSALWGVGLLFGLGIGHLAWQSGALNYNSRLCADADRNPWVYGHTATHVLQLADRLEQLARLSPEGHRMTIHVLVPDNYWPLPWYLRRFDQESVGYWEGVSAWVQSARTLPPPSVLIIGAELADQVDPHLSASYNQQMLFRLRPEVFLRVYVREDLWQAFLKSVSDPKE